MHEFGLKAIVVLLLVTLAGAQKKPEGNPEKSPSAARHQ